MRTIFGFMVLIMSLMLVAVSWLFDTEGAKFFWATLALATAMVAGGVLLDDADRLLAKPQREPRDAG